LAAKLAGPEAEEAAKMREQLARKNERIAELRVRLASQRRTPEAAPAQGVQAQPWKEVQAFSSAHNVLASSVPSSVDAQKVESDGSTKDPELSVVVVMYRMSEQIGNTLRSLTPPYQRSVRPEAYEIVLVDNGSPEPLPQEVWGVASNIHYHYVSPDRANSNPGVAMNWGVQLARAPILCLMLDGARMVTPGVLSWGARMTRLSASAVTEVRGWHLGPKNQKKSIEEGYNAEVERQLLESVRWQENGYRLFEVSAPSGSTRFGFFGNAPESGCLFMHRSLFDEIGDYDERYAHPGGGLVSLDFFWRAVTNATTVFTLLGEGHFHQIHGGASTGLPKTDHPETFRSWKAEYERLSRPFFTPFPYEPILVGHIPKECEPWMVRNSMKKREVV